MPHFYNGLHLHYICPPSFLSQAGVFNQDLAKIKRRSSQDLIDWRRFKVIEQRTKGHTQFEIAKMLQVGIGTVNRDLVFFRNQVKENNAKFIEKIQSEHEKTMMGINLVLKETWIVADNSKDNREKLHALSLAKDCYALLEHLLANEQVISEAIKFESEDKKQLRVSTANSALGFDTKLSSEEKGNKGDIANDIQRPEEKDRESTEEKSPIN
jgi:hypothetical protein